MKHSMLIAALFLLTACVTQQYSPQSFQVAGDYTQESSGVTFPYTVNGFRRVNIIKYDEKETDIGVGYNDPAHQIVLTVFSYPSAKVKSIGSPQDVIETARNQLFNDDYQRSKQDILNGHHDSQFIAEKPYHLNKYKPHLGAHGIFRYSENIGGKFKVVISHLYLIQIDNEMFKYRVTYPESRNNEKYINQFIESIELR